MAQTATILVTDLVGSTELRLRLGEERAEQWRRIHDAALAEQAAAGGGNVIKGLGDGVLVAFAGAAEALAAAVAMQQALGASARREGVACAMRVGVSAGDVTFEGGDCFGTPVIEAARLCAAAGPGEILVADLVKLLARGRGDREFVSRGSMTLKGLPDALEVWAVPWEPVRSAEMLRTTTPYVGRARERKVLTVAWQRAVKGTGGLVLVAGEPGIGKTRLVEEVCEQVVRPSGGLVLFGGCHDGDVAANAPFVEAITEWVRRSPVEEITDVLGGDAPVVARMVRAVSEVLPQVGEPVPLGPDAEIARLHDAVGQVLIRLGSAAPLMLVVDDLHWADDATIGMLRAVSRTAKRTPLLVIGTYRETDVDRRHPFAQALALLQREVEPERLNLSGLAADDVHSLLERLAGRDVPYDLTNLLTNETEGNPFFLRETLLHLWEEGELRYESGEWTLTRSIADLGVPAGIRDVIGRRLSRLSEATNRLLSVSALFEVTFPLTIAAEVAGVEEADALDAVDAALEAGIVRATDGFDEYAFTHALFRHTLVEELNPSRQVRTHRAIATALEKELRGPPSPEQAAALARHYQRSAALPNAERGVPYALAAAEDAALRYARREEHDALCIALELLAPGDERELTIRRRLAAASVFANVGSERVLEAARRAGELIAATEGEDGACAFVAELAVQAGGLDDTRLTWNLAELARAWLRPERRDAVYTVVRNYELMQRAFDDPDHPGIPLDTPEWRELIAVTQSLPYGEWAATAGGWFRLVHATIGSREEAQRAYDAGIACGADVNYPAWMLGAHQELRRLLREQITETLARGEIPSAVFDLAMLGRLHNVLGDYDVAEACFAEGFELLPRIAGTSNAAFQLLIAAGAQGISRGQMVPAAALSGLDAFGDSPDVRWAWIALSAIRSWMLASEGQAAAAMAEVERVLPVIDRAGGWAPNYPLIVHGVVYTLWVLQRPDGIELIERNLRAKIVGPDVRYLETDGRWTLAMVCALDGRADEARHWFEEARRVLTEQDSRTLLIALDHCEAEMNVRLGRPEDLARARALLERARSRCTHPAVAPWLARINALAASCQS